jgi:hypothetical protein
MEENSRMQLYLRASSTEREEKSNIEVNDISTSTRSLGRKRKKVGESGRKGEERKYREEGSDNKSVS